jgi:hypothetical protein
VASRKARDKKIDQGKWWEFHTTRSLSGGELKMFASRLAHGETISEITIETKKTHKTALYHRWMVWRHRHPEIGVRFRRLSRENKFARIRVANQEKRQLGRVAWVSTAPPEDMWAIINAVVPRHLFSELRKEICQRLALEVLERRCECSAAGLSKALAQHKREYYEEYADLWGDLSLDAELFGDGQITRSVTLGDTISRGLWD